MKVGILRIPNVKHRLMFDVYKQILDYNKIEFCFVDINDFDFWEKIKELDLIIVRVSQNHDELRLAEHIVPVISNYMKIPCFPNYDTVWHYDDKIKQYYLLKAHNIPVVDTYVFYEKQKALNWAKSVTYPVIFKLKGGAGSSNVKMINTKSQAINLINRSFGKGILQDKFDIMGKMKAYNFNPRKIAKFYLKPFVNRFLRKLDARTNYVPHKNYILFQKFYPGNKYDTRVAVIGERAWAFKRFNRKNDFRASGSDNYDVNRNNIDKQFIKIAFDTSLKFGFQSMAYDFIYDENNEPRLIEMSYTYGDYPEFSDGYWDPQLKWHDGEYVPEYLELVDALKMPSLKMPKIEIDSPYRKAIMSK